VGEMESSPHRGNLRIVFEIESREQSGDDQGAARTVIGELVRFTAGVSQKGGTLVISLDSAQLYGPNKSGKAVAGTSTRTVHGDPPAGAVLGPRDAEDRHRRLS